ncbi:MAG: DUF4190 domain-containing protein [Acidimicrobiales bacterium]|mgnify:FL=1|nr:DUF4190 domain-containing protein [Acidimicrobiales bacterium]
MARCLLCTSTVDDAAAVCPHCGGAVAPDEVASPWDDPTRIEPIPTETETYPSTPPPGPPSGPGGTAFGPGAYAPGEYAPGGYGVGGYGGYGAGTPASAGYPSGGYGVGGYAPGGPVPGGYGSPYAAGGYGYAPYPGYVRPVPTDNLAVASLITVIVGVVTAGFCGLTVVACPVGAVMGHVALSRIGHSGDQGRGYALAAIIIGWAVTLLGVLAVAAFIAFAASA